MHAFKILKYMRGQLPDKSLLWILSLIFSTNFGQISQQLLTIDAKTLNTLLAEVCHLVRFYWPIGSNLLVKWRLCFCHMFKDISSKISKKLFIADPWNFNTIFVLYTLQCIPRAPSNKMQVVTKFKLVCHEYLKFILLVHDHATELD